MNKEVAVWELEPHTQAKHDILRCYLSAWFPILAQGRSQRIVYVDGFAGPGEYLGGEPGSPIIALTTAAEHQLASKFGDVEMVFIFIERDAERFVNLDQRIGERQWPPGFRIERYNDEFANVLGSILDDLGRRGARLAPAFFFIDPFGPTGFPMPLIQRLATNPRCEVLINFNFNWLNRFLDDRSKGASFDELFGCPDWIACRSLVGADREGRLRYLYQSQLQGAGFRGVLQFQMVNRFNQTQYYLFYGTKHHLGMRVMKDAMWDADPTGAFAFSDVTDPKQGRLFDKLFVEQYIRQLTEDLAKAFKGMEVPKNQLEQWVDWHTSPPYRQPHLTAALRLLENASQIQVVTPSGKTRRRHTYPDWASIKFV